MLIVYRMIVWGACLFLAYKSVAAMTRPRAGFGAVWGAFGLLLAIAIAITFYRYHEGMPLAQLIPVRTADQGHTWKDAP